MNARTLAVALLVVLAATVPLLASENDLDAARRIFREANDARQAAGLPPLAWDDRLVEPALAHTRMMIRWGQLSHQLPGEEPLRKRIARTSIRLNRSGENVSYNSRLEDVHSAFMKSPGHRANIMSEKFNAMGVAVVRSGDLFWVTQNFAWRLEERSNHEAEEQIAAAVERQFRSVKLRRVERQSLREAACTMASGDRVQPARGWVVPGGRHSFAFTASDLSVLPPSVRRVQLERDVRSYAVGACFSRSPSFPSGTYWVLLVFLGSRAS